MDRPPDIFSLMLGAFRFFCLWCCVSLGKGKIITSKFMNVFRKTVQQVLTKVGHQDFVVGVNVVLLMVGIIPIGLFSIIRLLRFIVHSHTEVIPKCFLVRHFALSLADCEDMARPSREPRKFRRCAGFLAASEKSSLMTWEVPKSRRGCRMNSALKPAPWHPSHHRSAASST